MLLQQAVEKAADRADVKPGGLLIGRTAQQRTQHTGRALLLHAAHAAQKGAEEACGGGGLEVAACAAGAQGTAEQRPEQAVVGIVFLY